jgi:hypothetical protein
MCCRNIDDKLATILWQGVARHGAAASIEAKQWGAAAILLQAANAQIRRRPNPSRNPWGSAGPAQPLREVLLLIPCRCSKRKGAAQSTVVVRCRRHEALSDPRHPDPRRRARGDRRAVVLHLALVRARRRSGLHAASGSSARHPDRLERHLAATRHRRLRQAGAEWRPPRLYRGRARLPGHRALHRRC